MSLFEIEKAYKKLDEAHMHSELKAIKDERAEEKTAQTAVHNQVENQYWKSGVEILKAGAGMYGIAGNFSGALSNESAAKVMLLLVDSKEKREMFQWAVGSATSVMTGNLDARQMRSRHEQEFANRKVSVEQQKKSKKNDALERQRDQVARLFAELASALRTR